MNPNHKQLNSPVNKNKAKIIKINKFVKKKKLNKNNNKNENNNKNNHNK